MDAERQKELRTLVDDMTREGATATTAPLGNWPKAWWMGLDEALDAIEERDAKLSIACEALGPFAESPPYVEFQERDFRAARTALEKCQPDANPLEDLRKMLRECQPLLLDPAETNANRRRGLVRKIDAEIGEEDELDKFGRSDGNVPLTETELIDQAADDDARREADGKPDDHIPDVTKKVVDDE